MWQLNDNLDWGKNRSAGRTTQYLYHFWNPTFCYSTIKLPKKPILKKSRFDLLFRFAPLCHFSPLFPNIASRLICFCKRSLKISVSDEEIINRKPRSKGGDSGTKQPSNDLKPPSVPKKRPTYFFGVPRPSELSGEKRKVSCTRSINPWPVVVTYNVCIYSPSISIPFSS